MKTTLITIMASAFLLIMFGQCRDNSKHLTYDQAMRFRENYKNADSSVIRRLFGVKAAQGHNDETTILASVAFSKDELEQLKPFFLDTIPDFSKLEPLQDQFDGYRIHVGIDTSWGEPTEVYILTFGDIKQTDEHRPYLQDKLNLGIYRFKNKKLDFDKYPEGHGSFEKLTHLSCNPNCEGDKLQ